MLARGLASRRLTSGLLKLPKKVSRQKHMLRHWKFDGDDERCSRRVEDADDTECAVSNLRGAFFAKEKPLTQVFTPQHPVLGNALFSCSLARSDERIPSPHRIIYDRVEKYLHTLVRAI